MVIPAIHSLWRTRRWNSEESRDVAIEFEILKEGVDSGCERLLDLVLYLLVIDIILDLFESSYRYL